jgi:hypothetical protein
MSSSVRFGLRQKIDLCKRGCFTLEAKQSRSRVSDRPLAPDVGHDPQGRGASPISLTLAIPDHPWTRVGRDAAAGWMN